MWRSILVLAAPAALALVLGCSSSAPKPDHAELVAETAEHAAAWANQALSRYTFQFGRYCFCDSFDAIVTISDGDVESTIDLATQQPLTDDLLEGVLTIDELFAFIYARADVRDDRLSASFDEALSFPTEVFSDPCERCNDDELRYFAQSVLPEIRAEDRSPN